MIEIFDNVYLTYDEYQAFMTFLNCFFLFVVYPIFGTICAIIAGIKGRSKAGYWFFGYFTGIVAIIVISCLPKIKPFSYENRKITKEPSDTELYEKLLKYKHFYEAGVMSEEEYQKKVSVINYQLRNNEQPKQVVKVKPTVKTADKLINEVLKDPNSNIASKKEQLKALYKEHKITKEELKTALTRLR